MATRVVNISLGQPYDVYVGRPGKGLPGPLGNPVKVGARCPICAEIHHSRGETIPCFDIYFEQMIAISPEYRALVDACEDKALGCFCVDRFGNGPCHAHTIVRYLEKKKANKVT